MLTQSDFEQRIISQITDPDIIQRHQVGDPLVVQQVKANAAFLALLAQEIDTASIEPFIKTRERSILADATNKGILPIAKACQHLLTVENKSSNSITLSQGRQIEDHAGGRLWRLLSSITVAANGTSEVLVEQSEYREVTYPVASSTPFLKFAIELQDNMFLAGVEVKDQSNATYIQRTRWMNTAKGEKAFCVTTDSLRRLYLEFGDDERAGHTATAGDTLTIGLLETYGEVDTERLKDASLVDVYSFDEQRVNVRFKQTNGLVRTGANPLDTSQLRMLSNYPALYNENAVFLGNFDYAVRQRFMSRCNYLAVWNENEQERYNPPVSYNDINHLFVAVKAKVASEQTAIENEIKQFIGILDSLYLDKVHIVTIAPVAYQIGITGRLAAVHDLDSVKQQIKDFLVGRYGQGKLNSNRWLPNGFNRLETATQLRQNIPAFQDNISDFTLTTPTNKNKPQQWVYVTNASITINLERTAEIGASWIL